MALRMLFLINVKFTLKKIWRLFIKKFKLITLLVAIAQVSFQNIVYATSKPILNVDCEINIENIAAIRDQKINKKIVLEGSEYLKTGNQIVASFRDYKFKVVVAEILTIGEESEITGFYTEIIDLKKGEATRSRSGVNYLNDSLRSSSITVLGKNKKDNIDSKIYFECLSYIHGPNILEKMTK